MDWHNKTTLSISSKLGSNTDESSEDVSPHHKHTQVGSHDVFHHFFNKFGSDEQHFFTEELINLSVNLFDFNHLRGIDLLQTLNEFLSESSEHRFDDREEIFVSTHLYTQRRKKGGGGVWLG